MATKTVKKNKDKSTGKTFKSKAVALHDGVLLTSDEIVEETLATGKQWQNLFAKTLKKGTFFFGKQQDLILTGLEMAKDQYTTGNNRFKKLFSSEPIKSNKPSTPTQKTSKTVAKKVSAKKVKATPIKKEAVLKNTVAKNDLKIIEGIGPKIEELLNKAGILNFEQLKSAKIADLKNILKAAGSRYLMHDPGTWNQQAKLAADGKMEELKTLQSQLKGGK